MAFTANLFTDTLIGNIKLNEREALVTSRMAELNYEIVAGQAILNNQDPVIVTNGFGQACMNADIYTLRSASLDKGNKTIACAVGTGPKAGSEKLTLTKEVLVNLETFSIDDVLCNNAVTFASQWAYLSMKAKIALEVKLSKALVAAAVAGQDTAVASWFETPGAVNGDVYEIAKSDFSSAVLGDLFWAGRATDMVSPIVVNGRNLFNAKVMAEFEHMGCCSTNAALNSNKLFQLYWDAKNVDSVTGANSSLVIDKNALLFWSSPGYSNLGMASMMTEGAEAADRYHFVDTLPRLQYYANGQMNPIYVDVRVEKGCVTDALGYPRDAWKVEMILTGALELNLPNADAGLQGIIHVQQIAGV
jgi:hypothetical protein